MSSALGIAILGAGIFAKESHLPALASLGNSVALRAVYSRSLQSAQDLADAAQATLKLDAHPDVYHDADPSADLDALLARSDIVAVIVVLPITTQPSIIVKALSAGKHVLSEKPVAKDVTDGIALIKEYEQKFQPKGLVWRVAENFESEPGYLAAGRAIREGKIGKVAFFRLQAVNTVDKTSKWYKTPWRTVPDYQGGFLLDGGVHSAALLRVLLPSKLTHLSSFASLNKDYLAPLDTINAIIKTADGSHGIFELSFGAPSPSRTKGNITIVTGTSGWLDIDRAQVEDANGKHDVVRVTIRSVVADKDGKVEEETTEVIDERPWGVEAELASFVAAVNGHDDGLGSARNALKDVAVIQAALDSKGELVDLEKLTSGL